MNKLKRRILDLSHKYKLSHIGSCLTAVDLIDGIYKVKKPDEPFILSQGHAGLALYVVLEKYEKRNPEKLILKHGTHPNRDIKNGITYWVVMRKIVVCLCSKPAMVVILLLVLHNHLEPVRRMPG